MGLVDPGIKRAAAAFWDVTIIKYQRHQGCDIKARNTGNVQRPWANDGSVL